MQELNLGRIIWDLTSGRFAVQRLSYKISLTLSCSANACKVELHRHETSLTQACNVVKGARLYTKNCINDASKGSPHEHVLTFLFLHVELNMVNEHTCKIHMYSCTTLSPKKKGH